MSDCISSAESEARLKTRTNLRSKARTKLVAKPITKPITTPIFYASGSPHLGHAYSGFIADTIARFHRLLGEEVVLITGTDENGQKIERTAQAANIDLYDFVTGNSRAFRQLWSDLDLHFDQFIRTTDCDHHKLVTNIWNKLVSSGDIYLGTYKGLYCVECEQFYSHWQLGEGCCPIHHKPVEAVSEPSYLFRLSRYRGKLLEFYQLNPEHIKPSHYQESIIRSLQTETIDDLSISRFNVNWGVPVPGDSEHVVYVWLDALFSYITALEKEGVAEVGLCESGLSEATHVIGKDILQFHCIYWPAFLLAAGLPTAKEIVVHGWWTFGGDKISKSNPATVVKPVDLAKELTVDGLRYGLLRQKPLARDGNFNLSEFKETINSDLSNNLGNLVKRHVTLVNKFYQGSIDCIGHDSLNDSSIALIEESSAAIIQIRAAFSNSDLQLVCHLANKLISSANRYIHLREPWKYGKGNDTENVKETLCIINAVLRTISIIFSPVIPTICKSIRRQLKLSDQNFLWPTSCDLSDVAVEEASTVFERLKSSGGSS